MHILMDMYRMPTRMSEVVYHASYFIYISKEIKMETLMIFGVIPASGCPQVSFSGQSPYPKHPHVQ